MNNLRSKIRAGIDSLRGKHLREIGSGCFRTVYSIQSDEFGSQYKGKVLKVAKSKQGRQANSAEMRTWMTVKGTELEKYFCPIYDRSDDFQFIIMEKVKTDGLGISDSRELRQEITARIDDVDIPVDSQNFLDIKASNMGVYNNRLVMVDYPYGASFEVKKFNR